MCVVSVISINPKENPFEVILAIKGKCDLVLDIGLFLDILCLWCVF